MKPADLKVTLLKADKNPVQSNALDVDAFSSMYYSGNNTDGIVLEPPFNIKRILEIAETNNTVLPCINAMQTNIDATGYEIVNDSLPPEDYKDAPEKKTLDDFFSEPWIRETLISQRKKLRYFQEAIGNAYLEVMRDNFGEVIFARVIDAAASIRLVRNGPPINEQITISRNGEDTDVWVSVSHRRFIQQHGASFIYFKEFDAKRHLNKWTGRWAKDVPYNDRATEIIHFPCVKMSSPYGYPRWISQMPSAVGSRLAEEDTVRFLRRSGIPPLLIALLGGNLKGKEKAELEKYLNNPDGGTKAAVLEIDSSGGSLEDKENIPKMQVERFGNEQQKDALFAEYDKDCEGRIRSAFRLPKLFVGRSDGVNYATAFASILMAEAQVFQPERSEFDEIINATLVRDLVGRDSGFVFRSKSLSSTDMTVKLKALGLAKGSISGEDLVAAINEITGLSLTYDETITAQAESVTGGSQQSDSAPNRPANTTTAKSDSVIDEICGCLTDDGFQFGGTVPQANPDNVAENLLLDAPHGIERGFPELIESARSLPSLIDVLTSDGEK